MIVLQKISATLLFTCIFMLGFSQIFTDIIFNSKVKSVQVYNSISDTTNPVISLLGKETINIEFDFLHSNTLQIRYEIFLCDKNWNKSPLIPVDYLSTIGILRFEDVQNSVNTTQDYVHYSASFPNQNISFKLSGNYIIQVYNDETDELLFQKRCMVTEQIVGMETSIKQATNVELMDTHHEVDISILPLGFPIKNSQDDITLVIMQNGRWDNCIRIQKPSHIYTDKIVYDFQKENTIPGGSEFRQFSFKNLNFIHEKIARIEKTDDAVTIYMKPDDIRMYKPYTKSGDLNGHFSPSYDVVDDTDFAADYCNVIFNLPYRKQVYDTLDMYIVGGFNQWQLTEENKMTYSEEQSCYTADILLKQGYYDYAYAQASPNALSLHTEEIEGCYSKTENTYEIFAYIYDIENGYDRIIAYKKLRFTQK